MQPHGRSVVIAAFLGFPAPPRAPDPSVGVVPSPVGKAGAVSSALPLQERLWA